MRARSLTNSGTPLSPAKMSSKMVHAQLRRMRQVFGVDDGSVVRSGAGGKRRRRKRGRDSSNAGSTAEASTKQVGKAASENTKSTKTSVATPKMSKSARKRRRRREEAARAFYGDGGESEDGTLLGVWPRSSFRAACLLSPAVPAVAVPLGDTERVERMKQSEDNTRDNVAAILRVGRSSRAQELLSQVAK